MHDRQNNKDFWDEIAARRPRQIPDPDPWEAGDVAVLVVGFVGLAILIGLAFSGVLS